LFVETVKSATTEGEVVTAKAISADADPTPRSRERIRGPTFAKSRARQQQLPAPGHWRAPVLRW
jgi:hypothetical protein